MPILPKSQSSFLDGCQAGSIQETIARRRPDIPATRWLAVAVLALGAASARSATFTVSTPAELAATLQKAGPGDIIRLNPGDYGVVTIKGVRNVGKPVVIRPVSARPRLSGLTISSSSGIVIANVDVIGSRHPLVAVHSAQDIRLAGLTISMNPDLDPWNDTNTGVHIRFSQGVSLTDSRLRDLKVGLYMQRSQAVVIADNEFAYLREGMNVTASRELLIRRNRFQHFYPRYDIGEHPDAIQFWMTNETVGSSRVVIADNYIATGGPRSVQGMFLGSSGKEYAQTGNVPYFEVEVRNNIYYGSAKHGITLSHARDSLVWGNTIFASPHADLNKSGIKDPTGQTSGGLQPNINIINPEGVRIIRNIAMNYTWADAGFIEYNNIDLWDTQRRFGVPVTDIFASRPTADIPGLSAFAVRSNSLATELQAGARLSGKVGVQVTGISAVLSSAQGYHASLANFQQWFSPLFLAGQGTD